MKISREFKVGSFAVIMIACLYWGINFLKGEDIFSNTTSYYAQYDNISGVQSSASIFIKGFKVGTVTNMEYNPKKSEAITIKLNINSNYDIPVNSTARVFSDGIMGGKAIEIILGDSNEYLHRNDTLVSMKDKDLFEVASGEFDFFKQRADQISSEAILAMQNINKMFTDNQDNFTTTMQNMSSMSSDLKEISLSERESIKTIISDISVLTTTLKNNAENIDSIVGNIEGLTDSLNNSGVISALAQSVEELHLSLSKINDQQGTLGKLVGDQGLYDSLVMATTNLSLLFEDIKTNPNRYLNISVFGKKSTAN